MLWLTELFGTTEHVTLYMTCRLNRCRYNRVRLYIVHCANRIIAVLVDLYSCGLCYESFTFELKCIYLT